MNPWSLQSRVASISTIAICTGVAFGGIGMYQAASIEDDQVVDERAERLAQGILKSAKTSVSGNTATSLVQPLEEEAGVSYDRYQIWRKNGTELSKSFNASTTAPLIPFNVAGSTHFKIDNDEYCAYSVATDDRDIIVQVALREPERAIAIGLIAGYLLPLMLLPLFAILYLNRYFIRRTFQSLDGLVRGLQTRDPLETITLQVSSPSMEMIPIIDLLEDHVRRVGRAMSAEQGFTSFAAHELRTPLAGIRAQAQLAAQATELRDAKESLQLVMQGVDQAALVIDQLIDLNRIEGMTTDVESEKITMSLATVVQQILDEMDSKIRSRELKVTTSLHVGDLSGIPFAIYLMLRNLLANAILYTPRGGHIDIVTRQQDGGVTITIDDSGAGIPAAERERAFAKFDRLGKSSSEGVGLGLAIVAHAAKLHQAKIELLDSPLGGLRAAVTFN